MDLHIIPGAKAEDVAEAHVKDLYCQDEYGCKAITYWFDEERGKAFCLIEAPDEAAVNELHKKAHGLIPNQVVPVDPSLVESFLGRLTDPADAVAVEGSELKIFEDSAYRYLMYVKLPDFNLLAGQYGRDEARLLEDYAYDSLNNFAGTFEGRRVMLKQGQFLYSFVALEKLLECALQIRNTYLQKSPALELKIIVGGGEPLTPDSGFFEKAFSTIRSLSYPAFRGNILVSSELGRATKGLLHSRLKEHSELIEIISADREAFLSKLVQTLEASYMNPELDVGLLSARMNYSNSKLYRMCREYTGMSPNRFVRVFRLYKAKKLLRDDLLSISEVGFKCGFNTPSYFTRCFLQSYGMNPTDYILSSSTVNDM
ncbi:nickel-binding protein [Robertkochia marina]|nr:nickel-binding protein [Robertkochia marina]